MSTELNVTEAELSAWVDEELSEESMIRIELLLRQSEELRTRLALLISERDQGAVTVGDVWRRHRLSCPSRHELGSFLLDALTKPYTQYIQFHLEIIGCTKCQANLADLQSQSPDSIESTQRRQRIFASSVGQLRKDPRH